jgi:hypothetical protein
MTTTATLSIRRFDVSDTDAVVALWQEAFPEYRDVTRPQRNPHLSIANKLATQPELFFVAVFGERIVGTVMGATTGTEAGCIRSRWMNRCVVTVSARVWSRRLKTR